jgi:hypothetical protein
MLSKYILECSRNDFEWINMDKLTINELTPKTSVCVLRKERSGKRNVLFMLKGLREKKIYGKLENS